MTDLNSVEPDALVGTLFDEKYLLQRLLGRGGYSVVYQALQTDTERTLALKILLPKFAQDQTSAKRFQNEAKFLHQLVHPNIAQVYGFGVAGDGSIYLTLEYLQGVSLDTLLNSAALPTPRIIPIFKQIALAVAYAHEKNIVHRDLKPLNVIVFQGEKSSREPPQVKVLDFGIASLVAPDVETQQRLTASGVSMGTPAYMSPEQSFGTQPDLRSDIYSLGCMLYEALCGHPPFKRDSAAMLLLAQVHDAPPPIPVKKGDKLGQALAGIAMKCLNKQPADRYQSMTQVVDLFTALEAGEEVDVESPATAPQPKFYQSPYVLAALCVGIICAIWFANSQRNNVSQEAQRKPVTRELASVSALKGSYARDQANKVFANDPVKRKAMLMESAQFLRDAIKNAEDKDRQRAYMWEYCLTMTSGGLEDGEYADAAATYWKCSQLSDELQKTGTPEHRKDVRHEQVRGLQMAFLLYVYTLNNWEKGREIADKSLAVEKVDGAHTYRSVWTAEMMARHDRQPKKAAAYADKTLDDLSQYFQLDSTQILPYTEDAVIDYVSAGMTVKQAKQRVIAKLGQLLDRPGFTSIRQDMDNHLPNGSEARWRRAYEHPSHIAFAAPASKSKSK